MSEPVLVRCPGCQAKLKLPELPGAGKKIRCPKCKEVFSPGQVKQPKLADAVRPGAPSKQVPPAPRAAPSRPRLRKKPGLLSRGFKMRLPRHIGHPPYRRCRYLGHNYHSQCSHRAWDFGKKADSKRRALVTRHRRRQAESDGGKKKDILLLFVGSDWDVGSLKNGADRFLAFRISHQGRGSVRRCQSRFSTTRRSALLG